MLVIGNVPTKLAVVAVVVSAGAPVMPDVSRVSPPTKPVIVAVSVGFAEPYGRVLSSAFTVITALMTDSVKGKTREEAQALFEKFRHLVTDTTSPALDETDKLAVFSGVAAFPTRVKCAVLAWHTLRSALDNNPKNVSTENE